MKPFLLFFGLVSALAVSAQNTTLYAITDLEAGKAGWNTLRMVSLNNSGLQNRVMLQNSTFAGNRVEVKNKQLQTRTVQPGNAAEQAMYSGVAAMAYDVANDRLYYSTMFGGELRYVQARNGQQAKTYFVAGNIYNQLGASAASVRISSQHQGPVITRMTQGNDGLIYGLSNDGEYFFRLNTANKDAVVENLGRLYDAEENTRAGISVHASCTSWGGDMVAGADGQLYLYTMYQHAFKIDPATRKAVYLGKIEGLPGDFTLNGAAVLDDGSLLLSSAAVAGKYALINQPATLKAEVKEQPGWLNASDLAGSNLLFAQKGKPVATPAPVTKGKAIAVVYPNPVVTGNILIYFKEGQTGRYNLTLLDNAGGKQKSAMVDLNGQPQQVTMAAGGVAKGLYLLRITGEKHKDVQTIKVMIQ
jgi:hypothetical protein